MEIKVPIIYSFPTISEKHKIFGYIKIKGKMILKINFTEEGIPLFKTLGQYPNKVSEQKYDLDFKTKNSERKSDSWCIITEDKRLLLLIQIYFKNTT